jgi:nickel transport system substrate-binding protein
MISFPKLLSVLLITLTAGALFLGCGTKDTGNQEAKDTLVMAWAVNVGPLNPHMYSPNQMFAQAMVYDPLVDFDGKETIPALAERWTVSADGLVYTF